MVKLIFSSNTIKLFLFYSGFQTSVCDFHSNLSIIRYTFENLCMISQYQHTFPH